jgi:hypothetical protein
MKAASVKDKGEIQIEELPIPEPGPRIETPPIQTGERRTVHHRDYSSRRSSAGIRLPSQPEEHWRTPETMTEAMKEVQ